MSARYGRTSVLGPVSLSLSPGETVAVTGPSGVGKSTLLRIIAGLHSEYEGRRIAPERIAMVFQEPHLLKWRTAAQNLGITTGISTREAESLLAEVGLGGKGDRFPSSLSLGQQRRLSLARGFAADPDLLLMDEPFVSLDPALADEMMALFERLRAARKVSTVLVTHSVEEARRLADRVVRLSGSPATFDQ